MYANSERAVSEIVASTSELADASNWTPLDQRESNFNVVTNQASVGSKALTELCTNMVDAVLMKYAHQRNIDPRGLDVPNSVIEGVKILVPLRGMPSGVLAEVDDPRYLKEFAEKNLIICVTGSTKRGESLCFSFIDNGEGQRPDDFEDTFLSLSKGNKSNIPFVQGKYNMGSSGVLSYCGRCWYKLIVSRRYDRKSEWGWTLVRRRPGQGMPIAEYFRLEELIPRFESSVLHPMVLGNGTFDPNVHLASGTVIKLFDYQMESNATFNKIREALNQNLVSTILPFRLMDYRVKPEKGRGERRAQGVDERPLNGMEFLLLNRDEEPRNQSNQNSSVPKATTNQAHLGEIIHPDLGSISLRVIPLGRDIPGWLKAPQNTSRVFHAVNGQVQYKRNRAYLSTSCKLPGLKDRIVITVDASDLTEAAHNDVWKGDRENIRATEIGQLYEAKVTEVIRESSYLKKMQQRIANEELESLVEEGRIELFQNLVDTDPSIAQLLPGGSVIRLPQKRIHIEDEDEWQGNYSPTFVRIKARKIREEGADIALDGRRRLLFETDVVNDYFSRPDNRGSLLIEGLNGNLDFSYSLLNGNLAITLSAISGRLSFGDELDLKASLQDGAMVHPVSVSFKLKVVETRTNPPPGPPSPASVSVDDEEEDPTESRSLPPSKWLTRDGRRVIDQESEKWPESFTDQDGGMVKELEADRKLYCINYDNAHLHSFLNTERNSVSRRVLTEQFRIGMLVLMMGIEDAYSRMEHNAERESLESAIDEVRRLAARGAATVVLSIAKTLPTDRERHITFGSG